MEFVLLVLFSTASKPTILHQLVWSITCLLTYTLGKVKLSSRIWQQHSALCCTIWVCCQPLLLITKGTIRLSMHKAHWESYTQLQLELYTINSHQHTTNLFLMKMGPECKGVTCYLPVRHPTTVADHTHPGQVHKEAVITLVPNNRPILAAKLKVGAKWH